MKKKSQSIVIALIGIIVVFTSFYIPIVSSAVNSNEDYVASTMKIVQESADETTTEKTVSNTERKSVSGSCGLELLWVLDFETNILTISGTGAMSNYSSSSASPWYIYFSNIKTVIIEDGVTSVGDYAFYDFSNIVTVTLPNSIAVVGDYAFYNCYALNTVYYPGAAVEWNKVSVGSNNKALIDNLIVESNSDRPIFMGGYCGENVTYVLYIDGELSISGSGDMFDYKEYYSVPWYAKCEKVTKITIGDDVTYIGRNAFRYCQKITRVSIPDSVKSIGDCAFEGCYGLTNIAIGNNTTDIGRFAFYDCRNLKKVIFGNAVTSIGYAAFGGCINLIHIDIPKSVELIDSYAFMCCYNLRSIIIPKSVTHINAFAFDGCGSLDAVYYAGTEENWSNITFGYNNKSLLSATIYFEATEEDVPIEETTTRYTDMTTVGFTRPIEATTTAPVSVYETTTGYNETTAEEPDWKYTTAERPTTTKSPETTTRISPTTKVVQKNKTNIQIAYSSTTIINYGDTIILHAQVRDKLENTRVEWSVVGDGVAINPSDDGMTCRVTSVSNGSVVVTAKVVDENGEVCTDANGYEISDSRQLTSIGSFWQRIISFFKNLFGISRIILQAG